MSSRRAPTLRPFRAGFVTGAVMVLAVLAIVLPLKNSGSEAERETQAKVSRSTAERETRRTASRMVEDAGIFLRPSKFTARCQPLIGRRERARYWRCSFQSARIRSGQCAGTLEIEAKSFGRVAIRPLKVGCGERAEPAGLPSQ